MTYILPPWGTGFVDRETFGRTLYFVQVHVDYIGAEREANPPVLQEVPEKSDGRPRPNSALQPGGRQPLV